MHAAQARDSWRLLTVYSPLLFARLMMMIMMTINGYLLKLEIDVVLEIVADTGQGVTECVVQRSWLGFSS